MVSINLGSIKAEKSAATVELPTSGAGIKLELGAAPRTGNSAPAPKSVGRPVMEGSAAKEKADGGGFIFNI